MDELDEALAVATAELARVRKAIQARIGLLAARIVSVRARLAASKDQALELTEELKDLRAREDELTRPRR